MSEEAEIGTASPPAEKRPAEEGDIIEDKPDEKKAKVEPQRSAELTKLWKRVEDDPSDFTGWTYLLQGVDGVEVELGREAYDAFLFRYPYCYGYWKKYADLEKKKGGKDECMAVFERGIKAIPLSADLWLHFLNHVRSEHSDDQDLIRTQYERSVEGCGREWRSDKLWDHYVKWELETGHHVNVLKLYDRILRNQTQGLSHQFDMFREFVKNHDPKEIMPIEEFLELRKEALASLTKTKKEEAISTDEENQAMRESIIFQRRKVFKETEEKVQARWKFEDNIKRPYFHMKPLERSQLKNWSEYLKSEIEKNKDFGAIEILFERCVIACALYEEFWLKYASWLETRSDEDVSDKIHNVFKRACEHHLPKNTEIHLAWATFEERLGQVEKAAEILQKVPQKLSVLLKRINLERRRNNLPKVHELYKASIESHPSTASDISVKYARYVRLCENKPETAVNIINEALKSDPKNPKLYLQLLDIQMHQQPLNPKSILSVFESVLKNEDLPLKHRLLFTQRKLDFLEDFGDSVADLSRVQAEISKLKLEIKDVTSKSKEDTKEPKEEASKKSVNGSTTTYSATNSASYNAQHNNQYQQYGSRYSGAAAAPQYPSNYSQYSSYYQGYYQQ